LHMERNRFDFGIAHLSLLLLVAGVLLAVLVLQQDQRLAWIERQQQPKVLGEQITNQYLPLDCYVIPEQTEALPRNEDSKYEHCY
jgi:hypothetical protein